MRWTRGVVLVWLGWLAAPDVARAQVIAVSPEPNVTWSNCVIEQVPLGGSRRFYIVFSTPFAAQCKGATFKIFGLPEGYQAVSTPHPDAESLGDPFGEGCAILLTDCVSVSTDEPLVLYTVDLVRTGPGPASARLEVWPTPYGTFDPCPQFVTCDDVLQCAHGRGAVWGPTAVPSDPLPPDGATGVLPGSSLHWGYDDGLTYCCTGHGYGWSVFLGTAPDDLQLSFQYGEAVRPTLLLNTTYYWRVEFRPGAECSSATGPVWRFTTASQPVPIDAIGWGAVKSRFR